MAKIKVEITIPSDLKNEPIVYMMGHDFEIIPNIIEASFSTEMGWALLTLEGSDEEIHRLLAHLKSKNVTVNRR
jgi:hypothetical protein